MILEPIDLDDKPAAAAPIVDAAIIAEARADASPAAVPGTADTPNDRSVARSIVVRPIDYDAEAREVMEFAASILFPLRPALADVYTPAVRERIAAAGAPLLRKYNIDLSMLGPELTFAVVVIPLIAPTVAAIRRPVDRSSTHEKTDQKTPVSAATDNSATPAGGVIGAEVTPENPLSRFPGLHSVS